MSSLSMYFFLTHRHLGSVSPKFNPLRIHHHFSRRNHSLPSFKDPSLFKTNVAYVNGNWVSSISGKNFEVLGILISGVVQNLLLIFLDPGSGSLIARAPEFDIEDTQLAINAAAEAFLSFRKKTGRERSKILRKWCNLMVCNTNQCPK